MNTHVISTDDWSRLSDFVRTYRPLLCSEVEQIDLLKRKLHEAVIVPESKLSRTVVSMYTTANVVNLNQHEAQRYTLVYPPHALLSRGQLSILSPLGVALLGCKEGDFFECTILTGTEKFAVKQVLYQPAWEERNRFGCNGFASAQ